MITQSTEARLREYFHQIAGVEDVSVYQSDYNPNEYSLTIVMRKFDWDSRSEVHAAKKLMYREFDELSLSVTVVDNS